jgi:Zn-dependent M28 family amino/carboxypeptidase
MKILLPAALAMLAACASVGPGVAPIAPAEVARAADTIAAADLLRHIEVLSSDDFEGRSPGTRGEALTVDYIAREFKALGLQAGNADGTWMQKVPLVEYVSKPALSVTRGPKVTELQTPRDFVAWSPRQRSEVDVADSEIVFVGYGVIAPEYGWDDYKGVDMRGKTLVMLVNDPQVPDPADPSRLDDAMFKGRAMTYYGRWTYKYEIGEKVGAAAVLIVHETIPASYPYSVVVDSMGRENFELAGAARGYPPVAGWIPVDQAREMFAASGRDFEEIKKAAVKKDFRPVPLAASASFRVRNAWRAIESHNVVARIEGSDPALRHEAIVYTAHWDHLGWDRTLPGPKAKQVYHGARDNASGIAALFSIAKAFKALPRAPKRTVIFVATTSEERSLLGAAHYVENPIVPLRDTLANFNIDGINVWGRTRDCVVVGYGHSTLDTLITEIAAKQGRRATPEYRPESGGFFRSDQLAFIRAGIPAAYFGGGREYIGKPASFAEEKRHVYNLNGYHKPGDVIDPAWDLSGALEDLRLSFEVALRVAEGAAAPQWMPDSEFRAKRETVPR